MTTAVGYRCDHGGIKAHAGRASEPAARAGWSSR
jgi:hypothetical protein